MSATGYYLAFPVSTQLRSDADSLIELMGKENPAPQPQLIFNVLTQFFDEALDYFLLDLLDIIGLKGPQRKLVEFAAATLKKTTDTVLKRLIKKLQLQQQIEIAKYIDTIRLYLEPDSSQNRWLVAAPLTKEFYTKITSGHEKFRLEGVDSARPTLIQNLKEVIDIALDFFLETPIAILEFGPVLLRIIRFAIDSSLKLIHSVIDKVFAKFDQQEMTPTIEYFDLMLMEGPLHPSMQ